MHAWASLGAALTAALGAWAMVAPSRAAAFVGIAPLGARGTSEVRATYGGLFAGLGGACLVVQEPGAFAVAAAAWFGAALARAASMRVDRSASWLNAGGVLLEAALGLLLATGGSA